MHWLAALSFIGFSIARPHSGVHAVERSGAEQAVEWSGVERMKRTKRSQADEAERSGAKRSEAEWSGVERTKRTKRSQADEAERSGVERSEAEWSGVERSEAERGAEWSGVERSGAEWSGAERSPSGEQSVETPHEYVDAGRHWQHLLYISPGRRRATDQNGSGSGRYASTW